MCSAFLVIRRSQIRTARRFSGTTVGILMAKKTHNRGCWWECGEKANLGHCRDNMSAATVEASMEFSQKTIWWRITILYSYVPPGNIPSRIYVSTHTDSLMSIFTATLLIIARISLAAINTWGWIKQGVCPQWSTINGMIPTVGKQMELAIIVLTQENKYHNVFVICGI